jgi:predicted transposase/invertase (TIGR01784 family)
MKFVNPKNNVAFKKIFGNEQQKEILISFLNAVLDLNGDRAIEDLEILNPYQAPKLEGLKYTLLDVRARDKRGVTFIVEMQLENIPGLTKRFVYYAAKAYVSQIERGEDYPKLNRVIFIGILDFVAFSGEKYLTRHALLNTATCEQEIKEIEFNFIELPKFTKEEPELESILEKWLFFLKKATEQEAVPASANTRALQVAYEIANQFSWSQAELEVYDYWGMKAQDERGALDEARHEGEQIGLQKGRQQGEQTGLKKGQQQGERQATLKSLRQILTIRFDAPPLDFERRLEPLDLEALQQLITVALTLPTWAEFEQRVGELELSV